MYTSVGEGAKTERLQTGPRRRKRKEIFLLTNCKTFAFEDKLLGGETNCFAAGSAAVFVAVVVASAAAAVKSRSSFLFAFFVALSQLAAFKFRLY